MSIIRETVRETNQFTRNVANIRRIGIHHTGVDRSNIDCRESLNRHRNHWRSLGWTNDGYNEVIARDGRVFILHDPNHIANGVGNHNSDTYQIAFEGLGSIITPIQRTRLIERIRHAQQQFNVANVSVLGHNEFSGHATNSCPGINMTTLRSDVSQGGSTQPSPGGTHTVRAGETLWSIAQMHGTTVALLQQLNGMGSSTVISVGQVLILPTNAGGTLHHTVQPGETLWGISQLHGTTVAAIQALNGMGSSTVISVGQVLRVR